MGSHPPLLRCAVMTLALSSLPLFVLAAARADTPDYLYQSVTSSKNRLTVLAANATAILASESGTAGDTLKVYPLDGSADQLIAQPGSPMPDGSPWPAGVQFTRAAMNEKVVLFRSFVNGAGSTWGDVRTWAVATALYDLTTHRSTWLQPFLVVPQAAKDGLDHMIDLSGPNSIRTTAASDGSKMWLRWLDVNSGTTAIVAGRGDTIPSAPGNDTVAAFGPIRITSENIVVAAVHTGQGHELVEEFEPVAGGAWRPGVTFPLADGSQVKQLALFASDPKLVTIVAKDPQGSHLYTVRLDTANAASAPVPLNGWVVGQGVEYNITDADRHGQFFLHLLPYMEQAEAIASARVLSDSGLSLSPVVQPVFSVDQDTPNGPATQVGAGGLLVTRNGYPVFTLSAGGADRLVGATSFAEPRGPLPMTSASDVSYVAGGVTYPAWPFSGPGVAGFAPPVPQPDGSLRWPWYVYLFPEAYKEPDGTPWRLQWAAAGADTVQFTIPPNHFGPLPATINLNAGVTVGTSSLPGVNQSGTGSLDLLSGKASFNQPGSGVLASNVFANGDQARWRDLFVQLPVGPLFDDDSLDMPVLPPKPPAAGARADIAPWVPLHNLHLTVTQARVWLYDGNDKLIGAKPNPKLERDAQGNVSGVRLSEPHISAGQVAILRLEFVGVDGSVAHAADGSFIDLSTSNQSGSEIGRQDTMADLTDPNEPERLGDPKLGDLVKPLRDAASANQGILITHRVNPFFTRGVLLWNVEALRGKEAQLMLIADCTGKRDHKSLPIAVSGPPN